MHRYWLCARRASLLLAFCLVLPLVARAHEPASVVDPEREAILAAAAQDPVLQRVIEIGRENQVMEHLDYLTNHIGPRLTGSVKLLEAAEWAVESWKSWGMEAQVEEAGTVPVRFERGPWQGKMVEPEEMAFEFGTPSWSAGTRGKERGPAVMAPRNTQELEANRARFQGAWVLNRPGSEDREDAGDEADAELQAQLRRGMVEAGARGFITRTGSPIRLLGRSPSSFNARPRQPDIRLINIYFDRVRQRVEAGEEVVLEFDIRNYMTPGPAPFYNAIGMIRGTEFPEQYVVFGGHLDSYCSATGTIDNAVGSMSAFTAAHILTQAGVQPRRTLVFALWGGEEQGLRGSRAWLQQNRDKQDRISAYFNQDSGTNAIRRVSGTAEMMPYLRQALEPINLINPRFPLEFRTVQTLGTGGSSDHASFNRAGIPGFGWGLSGPASYGVTWHTNLDTYERALPDHMRHSAAAIAVAAYGMGNLDGLMPRERR